MNKYNKVIFVCNYAANYAGNFIASLNNLAKKLEHNTKIIFIFPKSAVIENWEIDLSNYQIVYSDFQSKNLIKTIVKNIDRTDKVIIHLHFVSALLLIKLRRLTDSKNLLVYHQHMTIKHNWKMPIKGLLLRALASKNIIYIGVSPYVYKDLCQEVGKNRCRLVVNAIDTKRLVTTDYHNNNILIFGTNFKGKGVDLAIEAIRTSRIASKVKLEIITHNIENVKKLIIQQYKEIPRFVKIRGTSTNISELYKNSFLFLSPSRAEAFSYSVVEAAYSGNQVIASDIPGQNTLKNIPGIYWIEKNNAYQLKKCIEKAYYSQNDRLTNVNLLNAEKYIEKHYSLDSWSNKIIDIYNE